MTGEAATGGRLGARLGALGEALPRTRGARFLLRADGRPVPGMGTLAALPAWAGWPAPRRARLGVAAALLRHRAALDRELSAARLAPVAALVGEDLFDALCDAPVPAAQTDDALPHPAALSAAGQDLLRRALPPVLGGGGDADAAGLVAQAATLAAEADA